MRISLVQTDIIWEDKKANTERILSRLAPLSGETDLAVLPEMFSTGFSMNSSELAESNAGDTITSLQNFTQKSRIALTGSFIAKDKGYYYNRAFFLTPEGDQYYYDKRHLFRMGNERNHFSAGNSPCILFYKGWNICLTVCYDLRFPVWCRNLNNRYDLLLVVANWPEARRKVWDILLQARAMENMAYVCGVNRIGTDGYGLQYTGGSVLYSAKGAPLLTFDNNQEAIKTLSLNIRELRGFRKKFPAWKDADPFTLSL
ncbi:MAG: amidohydrolase [Bacteroides sp.]|nr:amidohydrolase [Bacteroides sp.]